MKINKLLYLPIRLNYFAFIFLVLLLTILLVIPISFIEFPDDNFNNPTINSINNDLGITGVLLFGIIIAPLIETLIFQLLIIQFIRLLIPRPRKNFLLSVSASALAFSLIHLYNVYYVILTFMIGLILAVTYYFSIFRKESAFLTVALIHGLRNFVSIMLINLI